MEFERSRIRIARKDGAEGLSGWEPKDHEGRILPLPGKEGQSLLNDLNRPLGTLPKKAGLAGFPFHKTTQRHYLAVPEDGLQAAGIVQSELLAGGPSDQLLTNWGQNGRFRLGNADGPGL